MSPPTPSQETPAPDSGATPPDAEAEIVAADPDAGARRIAAAFADSPRRAALMPYLMGGFPDLPASTRIGHAYADAGADLIELGVPYSDPLADGPVIHAAGSAALRSGATLDGVLEVAGKLTGRLPVVVMCYANLIYARGLERFTRDLAAHGVSGMIVPDVPLEEAPLVRDACESAGIALIPLVAPTTPEPRLAAIGELARGFVYTVSVAGTTGERRAVDESIGALVARVRRHADVPVAVGFGVGEPAQARAVADAGADGVIIGSRLVREVAEAVERQSDPAAAVCALVAEFAAALDR
ncbi:MAG: Tryptophan synthase alpha chain [uncultured Solirubrobacteraceae bacterium]|uniref:Tryptophan synthase alpha chain n=1 Tax=uncultured Solirubrobacteraceae bacterium TaxID=1162706 RepID=A0A6J4S263_9ACTN|nr:MAG: Tryptophan synthase alpha chain [uncultured Solirubrobacteraceae bacterium]